MYAQDYYNLSKLAAPKSLLLAGGLGAGLGTLYGLGDSEHNYYNELFHDSTSSRAAQGALSGLAGAGAYKLLRGTGRGRMLSGLAGLLSSAGAAALVNPTLKEDNPYKLPF